MMTKYNYRNLGTAFTLVAALGLTGQVAQAAVSLDPVISSSVSNAASLPGSQAFPSFMFDFNADFDLAGFEVNIEFDPAKLTFNAAATTLTSVGGTFTLPTVLANMEAASTVPGPGPDFLYSPGPGDFGAAIDTGLFTMTGSYLSQSSLIPAGSTITLTGVFNLRPGFDSGSTAVRVYGEVFDPAFNSEGFEAIANVSAVPEPETWLMLLGGLGLIATRVRRRMR